MSIRIAVLALSFAVARAAVAPGSCGGTRLCEARRHEVASARVGWLVPVMAGVIF